VEKPESTVHTADASSVTGIELHRISKNLMSETDDGRYVAFIIPGDARLDYRTAAESVGAKNITLVPFDEAHKFSGYPPGGTPSMGYEKRVEVVLDDALSGFDTIYCGGGSTRMLLELRVSDIIRVNSAKVHRISKRA
jgi:Cys-tRNA(Pro)/Cys-tRNA(Cys) deacylase